jgi:hypothetical protein
MKYLRWQAIVRGGNGNLPLIPAQARIRGPVQ